MPLSRHRDPRQGATIRYLPVDLPQVYARTGGVLLAKRAPERQAYRVAELERWCRRLDIHVNPAPKFMCPDASLASRLVIAADHDGVRVAPLYKAILAAQWCEERDISKPGTLRDILVAQSLDADRLMGLAERSDIVDTYQRNTDEAVACGVFGSPSYVVDGELFWGQDRLDFLEEALYGPCFVRDMPGGRERLWRGHGDPFANATRRECRSRPPSRIARIGVSRARCYSTGGPRAHGGRGEDAAGPALAVQR
jgi:2-hydroxychromene-2-carboxylate isomerase